MKYIEAKRCFVRDDGTKKYLTYLQGKLLMLLIAEQGDVVTWEEMLEKLYGRYWDLTDKVNIHNLKKSIKIKTGVVITAISGLGLILETPVEVERIMVVEDEAN